jgi:hypothetical protein
MEEMRQEPRVQFHKVEVPQQSSALWFVLTCIFFILFIVIAVIAGYFYSREVQAEARLMIADYQYEALEDDYTDLESIQLGDIPPHFYVVKDRSNITKLMMIHRDNGRERVIYANNLDGSDGFTLYAVPQDDYDGRVFIQRTSSTGELSGDIQEIDATTGKIRDADFADLFPSTRTASSLSPDQSHILFLYDNPIEDEWQKQAAIVTLTTGETEILGSLSSDEYYSKFQGDNIQGGASGFDVRWLSGECVSVGVFEDASRNVDEGAPKALKEYQEYCL